MPYQGFAVDGTTEVSGDVGVINMNRLLLQKGDPATDREAAASTNTGESFYDDTDVADIELTRSNGSSWDLVIDSDAAAGTPSLRTLGTGSTQAAAGDHTH